MLRLRFQDGTLLVREDTLPPRAPLPARLEEFCRYDARVQAYRANASAYPPILLRLHREGVPYEDQARNYQRLDSPAPLSRTPRFYQQEALEAWRRQEFRGVVVLPTGTGKSFLAQMAIGTACRSTLVVVPTLDLLAQWALQLRSAFACPVGTLGGGSHDLQAITVSTYDSALLVMEHWGNRFGTLVVDECHHLPGPAYSQLARCCLAPFRLGLTATPERPDGLHQDYPQLLGPICYRKEITDLPGETVLAPYETLTLPIHLTPEEERLYRQAREIYVDFLRENEISLGSPRGWGNFLRACSRLPGGRQALQAYLTQRRIARSPQEKFSTVHQLLTAHRHDRTILFTADNATAYQLGNLFTLPVITHHTRTQERMDFLEGFRRGDFPAIVTSRVLNEGVDVPAANVGIVVSGSGSVREHVQRLGRILRPSPGKTALLYELVTQDTGETYTAERRRMHPAYGKPAAPC